MSLDSDPYDGRMSMVSGSKYPNEETVLQTSGALQALLYMCVYMCVCVCVFLPEEAEDIKKRWQEYTEELYKNDLHDPDNQDAVITYLEPDILEYKVKWALESITTNKASGGDGIPVELFHILKDDAESAELNMPANLENSAVATGLEKVSFHSNPNEKQCQRTLKLPHNCTHLTH